jgi:hypothetical protein
MTEAAPRIAFLTGSSDPGRCALSPRQRATLDTLAADAYDLSLAALNFPWNEGSARWRPVPLLRASFANAQQYIAARSGRIAGVSPESLERARAQLLDSPRTLLLVGSCGLTLLGPLIAPFDAAQRARLRVVAYGGVAPHWPQHVEGVHLRGHRDRIAAWFGPIDGPSVRRVAHGHMDYLEGETIVAAAREFLPWLRGLA